jgi:hypothetical protein
MGIAESAARLEFAYRRDRGHVEGEGWSAGAEEDR